MPKSVNFGKSERLHLKTQIAELFKKNSNKNTVTRYPLRLQFILNKKEIPNLSKVAVLLVVPKRKIKKAVHRNFVKRRLRESYRQNKSILMQDLELNNFQMFIAIHYLANERLDYKTIELCLIDLLKTLNEIIKKNLDKPTSFIN